MTTSRMDAKLAELKAQEEHISSLNDVIRIEFKRRSNDCEAAIRRFHELSKTSAIEKNVLEMTMQDLNQQKYFGIGLFLVACAWNAFFSEIYKLDGYLFFMAAFPYANVMYDIYKKESSYKEELTQRNNEIAKCEYELNRNGFPLALAEERHEFLERDERSNDAAIKNIEWKLKLNNALLEQIS
jgi:hypothetical protein